MNSFCAAPRTIDVVVELTRNGTPPEVPGKLQEHYPPAIWEYRTRTVIEIATQFSRPMYERMYMSIAVILSIVVPIAAYNLSTSGFSQNVEPTISQLWFARGVTIGATIATWLVVFLPIALWKARGNSRLNSLVYQWKDEDTKENPSYANLPPWRVIIPGIAKDVIVVMILVPVSAGIYLPPYTQYPEENAPPYQPPVTHA